MAKKTESNVPETVNSVEALQAKIASMREAQKKFASYTQEQVDKIFFEAAMAANKQRIPLARMACEETGMGVLEDKVIKNHYAAEYTYNAYKRVKTCGRDRGRQILRHQKDRRACGNRRRCYSYHQPDFHCYF